MLDALLLGRRHERAAAIRAPDDVIGQHGRESRKNMAFVGDRAYAVAY